MERDRAVRLGEDHLLDVNGLAEALATSITVVLPAGTRVRVADLPGQAALKVLAWRDRHTDNAKDALDLAAILDAASQGPFAELAWDDEQALEAGADDIVAAGAHRVGRLAALPFEPRDAAAVSRVLHDPGLRARLITQMRSRLAALLLDSFAAGFDTGAAGTGRGPHAPAMTSSTASP